MTNTEKEIQDILTRDFQPQLLEIIDESHLHAGHMGAVEGVSTHFRVKIVSEKFEGVPKIKQHKLVYKALEEQLNGDVHALALNTIKKSKWEA
ncbi:MAG: BolA family transcriptional regulator [Lentisphaeraceae bacterium]|nr:BolA family transcriptional regulator [Lentisphaeraceae bacterium]